MEVENKAAEASVSFEDLPMSAPPAPSAGPETMELSDTSKAAQEKHAQALLALEIDKRARSIFVPADIDEQKTMLRSMNEPVTLFAERPEDRRERLKRLLATREMTGALASGALGSVVSSTFTAGAVEKQKEVFYTQASESLLEARKFIAHYSFERAMKRLRAQATVADNPESAAVEDRHAARLYGTLKRMRPVISQAGDDRPLSACALAPDSSVLATSSWGSLVKVWDASGVELRCNLRGHTDRVVAVCWHPGAGATHSSAHGGSAATHGYHTSQVGGDSATVRGILASGSVDGTAKIWRVPDEHLRHPHDVLPGLDTTVDGKKDSLLDTSVRETATLAGHTLRLCNVVFHPSGRYLGTSSFDKTWRLWDVEHHRELLLQEGHAREVYALAFHPDGSLVASGDLGGAGRLWDIRSGKSIFLLSGHTKQLLSLDFSPDGFHVASGSDDNTSIVWDLRQRKAIYTIPAHKGLVSKVKFAPVSGEYLATASFDGSIKTWSTRDWAHLGTYTGHEGKITGFDIFHDESRFVSVSFDRTIKVWERDDTGL